MNHSLHNNEKEQFRKLFKKNKIDKFEERFNILKIFLKTEYHISLSELLFLTKKEGISAKPCFIKNTMDLMCDYGFAHKYKFKNKDLIYEHMHLGQHHDHMVCVKCNEILEFENKTIEKLQILIANNYGFHVLQHRMDLYGICSNCMRKQEKNFILSNAPEGEKIIIKKIIAKKDPASYLYSLGIRVGDIVEIIMNSSENHMVIALENRRLILCKKFAKKIIVKIK